MPRNFGLLLGLLATLSLGHGAAPAPEIWRLNRIDKIGGHPTTVEGAPRVVEDGGSAAVEFDGKGDGLFVAALPFAGTRAYTIEILFRPDAGGLRAQRFLHAHDDSRSWRALIETRLDGRGGWYLDTFVCTGAEETGVALADSARIHPTGRWYWAALRYDGTTMAHFVNGVKEQERAATFEAFGPGRISIGVRQNKVFWFKGAIREVRFHRVAVPDGELQGMRRSGEASR